MSSKPDSFRSFFTQFLNPAQQQAVAHPNGSLLVVAGAGSGKTRVITSRITHLMLERNVPASSIIALTFTNKAAHEMKERIATFLQGYSELPFVGTFHSYCVRLLKQHQDLLDTPFFSILDEDDKKKLLSSILDRMQLNKHISARNAVYHISHLKNNSINTSASSSLFAHPSLYDVYKAYEAEKRASRVLDFDDLLLEVLALFRKHPPFKQAFQERIRHILVDEYQDTNIVQHALLLQMAKYNNIFNLDSICAVGDEDQSIYSWRGATIANMLNFQQDFPHTSLIKIEQNYRSVQPILDIANNVIQHNTKRNPKTLWSEKTGTDRVRVLSFLSEYQEADTIAHLVSSAHKAFPHEKCAILYRTHAQSRLLEEALLKKSIPYKIIGGVQFYDRKEIKDLLAYLKLIANPFDRTSFFRVLNTPTRGLGPKVEEHIHLRWHNEPFLTFKDVARVLIEEEIVPGKKGVALEEFIRVFEGFTPESEALSTLESLIKKTQYLSFLKDSEEPQEATARMENIKELISAVMHFKQAGIISVTAFLDEVALLQDRIAQLNEQSNTVLLMTLHAAKGLEFDTVILAGLEEGLLPSTRALAEDDDVEEERRLFYVGITRARERLLITYAQFRYTYGQMIQQTSSRFIREIPKKSALFEECVNWTSSHIQGWINSWLKHTPIISSAPSASLQARSSSLENSSSAWRKNRTVMHSKYGVGIIKDTEHKNDGSIQITVQFNAGIKKIVSNFLKLL